MPSLRLSLRLKIMLAFVLVSTVVLAITAITAVQATEASGERANYLDKHFDKFLRMAEEEGSAEYAAARIMAQDPTLAQGLETGDVAVVVEAIQRLVEPLQASLAPNLVVVSDASGRTFPVGKGDVATPASDDWRETRLFQDVRDGKTVRGELAIVGRKAYWVSGGAVSRGGGVVGAVVLGVQLERFLEKFRVESTSTDVKKQHRVSLLREGDVIATVLSAEEKSQLPGAVQSPVEVEESGTKYPILKLGDEPYDFAHADATGYFEKGDPSKKIGDWYHIRTRSMIQDAKDSKNRELFVNFLIAAAVALLFGWVLSVMITRPLRQYIVATEDLARGKGDLTKRLEVQTRDEMGTLAGNLNRVFAKIHALAAGVQRSAFQVGASSGEISSVSQQMLQGAKEQAAKISGSTAAVTELSSSIQQVAENAAAATATAKKSGEAVTDAIQRLDEIRKTVEDAASRISTLGESVKRIGNIVEVIRQISEQTTMLALNAAIEAAHAGEHGRGFAVVADEVSSLAKRVGQSARDIEDLIATIRDQTGEAVRVMETGSREVEDGTSLVTKTLADLQTLISVIDDTASAVQEQAIASDEIARNMDAVQRIASEVLASSENAVSQGERLQTLADGLEESVKGFKIDPERALLDEAELKALPEGEA